MTRRRDESGFALLFVFVMAAFVAIALYIEMPRVAFETQRNKEQLLVDRGMEYRRGIQLFYRKFKRFPTRLEELDSTNNIRFLRKRYVDPMTGKEEWRLIHIGPGGMLTDSLVQVTPAPGAAGQTAQGPGAPGSPSGAPTSASNAAFNASGPNSMWNPQTQDQGGGGLNMATARRPSDHVPGGLPGVGAVLPAGQPGDANQQNPTNPANPTPPQYQGQPGQTGDVNPVDPGQPVPVGVGQTGQPVQPGVQGQPPFPPGRANPQGMPPVPGQPGLVSPGQLSLQNQPPGAAGQAFNPNQQPGVVAPAIIQASNGVPINSGVPGSAPGPNGVLTPTVPNVITNLLTSARQPPAGLNGAPGTPIGAGIAGVATTYKGEGIKIINDRKKYQEWEFVYDFKTDRSGVPQPQGQTQGGPNGPVTNGGPPPPPAK